MEVEWIMNASLHMHGLASVAYGQSSIATPWWVRLDENLCWVGTLSSLANERACEAPSAAASFHPARSHEDDALIRGSVPV